MGDKTNAVKYYKAIEKLENDEQEEVRQAAEMQIGDIYLEQTEKKTNAFKLVDTVVIPQYKKAIKVDKKSNLAFQINEKILNLQRKYDLVLFQLHNGRVALYPPYFLRIAGEYGNDSNVTFAPTETTIEKSKQASTYGKIDAFGRYTFYIHDFMSIAPEMRFNSTRYYNREPEIYKNDNYLLAPSLRNAFEHTLFSKPASVLFDYDYSKIYRDVNAEKDLQFNSESHTFMLGERLSFFSGSETILRVRRRNYLSYLNTMDSRTSSYVVEHIKNFSAATLLLYLSYDRTRVTTESFDTNSMTFRSDLIYGRIFDFFTPSTGFSFTRTDPINNRDARGIESLFTFDARISKTFGTNWRVTLKYDFYKNQSRDEDNFAYQKYLYAMELEYVF